MFANKVGVEARASRDPLDVTCNREPHDLTSEEITVDHFPGGLASGPPEA